MPSPATCEGGAPAIELDRVGVRYRLPRGGTRSLKEIALLSLRRRLAFDDFWALREVDLRVSAGEQLGIIGLNGAGKSTLLQVIARVVTPSAGTATLRGRIAPLLQLGAGFDLELTGRENIFLNGALLGMRRAEIAARLDEILDFADLEAGFIDVPLRAYSSGMVARLGFAVGSAADPDILLLDEILAVGDEGFQAKCLLRMRGFAERGTTMLLVSHSPEVIRSQCSRAIWIEAGQIRVDGEPDAVLASYHDFLNELAALAAAFSRRESSPTSADRGAGPRGLTGPPTPAD